MKNVPSRQVHLDFHTSEHIPGVGHRFSKKKWQQALKIGNVNAINVFAKCHHGWSYYPTRIGHAHPTLKTDLLGRQIAGCHEIGVNAPIYFTVGWSVNDAETHSEWCARDKAGSLVASFGNIDLNARPEDPRPNCSWLYMCPSGGYHELILAQTEEICREYDVDGFWYDLTNQPLSCYCETCRRGMQSESIDVDEDDAVRAYSARKWHCFYTSCREMVHDHHPNASVFFNGTTDPHDTNRMHAHNTQNDLEDLPTTWWGYDVFPLRARFFARENKPYVAMSGKFHTSWGEFGGFKHREALRYEAAAMIAFGARCNFGDQLHPNGEIDMATYGNIGHAFRYVKKIEKYGLDGTPCATLGLWWGSRGTTSKDNFAAEDNNRGVANMLLESQIDFEIVDSGDDLSPYAVIVLAGAACLDRATADELEAYMTSGGKLLVLGEGGLDAATRSRFVLDVGARYLGPPRHTKDYLVVDKKIGKGLVESPFLCDFAGLRARVTTGEVLASIREPYFDRTYARYCSHANTPYREQNAPHAGAWCIENMVYLPHPLGKIYLDMGPRLHRDMFVNALRLVYPKRKQRLVVAMPSGGRVSLVHQIRRKRYIAHLLYGPPMPRGMCQVIEDLVPIHNVPVTLRVREKIRKVRLPREKQKPCFRNQTGSVSLTVPTVQCHQMVVFEY